MDWWPLTRSNSDIIVEWSPQPGNNLRARKIGGQWVIGKCKKAKYALMTGESMAVRAPTTSIVKVRRKNVF